MKTEKEVMVFQKVKGLNISAEHLNPCEQLCILTH